MTDNQDPGFAPEAGGGLRQREIQGFRVDSEKRSGKGLCSMEGRRQGVRVAPQEIRSPVPHLKQAVGWRWSWAAEGVEGRGV